MQIGIVCPTGPLDRFGYQYTYRLAIESLVGFATRLYLISSTRSRSYADRLLAEFPFVEFISDERTWFDQDEQGDEIFSLDQVETNVDLGLKRCIRDSMDCALQIHVNQYIQDRNRDELRRLCQAMLDEGRPFEWIYSKYQLGPQLFHADTRRPWILNLQVASKWKWRTDSLHDPEQGRVWRMETGDYRMMDHVAIVDAGMERTAKDLMDFREFTRGYAELKPEEEVRLDWDGTFSYYVVKYLEKVPSPERLDAVGSAIAASDDRRYVSHDILDKIRGRSGKRIARRIRRAIKRRAALARDHARLAWHSMAMVRELSVRDRRYREYLQTQLERAIFSRNQSSTGMQALIDRITDMASSRGVGEVLCVGCGGASEIDRFRQSGFHSVIGIDLFSTRSDVLVMDMHAMRFGDDRFDVVFARYSLEHAIDPLRAASEFIRVAKPGALVAIEARTKHGGQLAELVDFRDANGILSTFSPHVGKVLLNEDIPPSAVGGWKTMAQVIFEVAKPARTGSGAPSKASRPERPDVL